MMSLLSRWFKGNDHPKVGGITQLQEKHHHTCLGQCEARRRVQVVGEVVATGASGSPGCFWAQISDNTGSLRLVWPGRKKVPGIVPGTFVVARGIVGETDGELRIIGPEYSIEVP